MYCEKWHLVINLQKTKVVIFSRGKHLDSHVFTINSKPLETVPEFVYLGILFYQNGTFHKAEKRLASQGRKALGAVISRAGSLCLDIRSKCTLYNSCVASVLLYGCEALLKVVILKLSRMTL